MNKKISLNGNQKVRCVAVEPASCPKLTMNEPVFTAPDLRTLDVLQPK